MLVTSCKRRLAFCMLPPSLPPSLPSFFLPPSSLLVTSSQVTPRGGEGRVVVQCTSSQHCTLVYHMSLSYIVLHKHVFRQTCTHQGTHEMTLVSWLYMYMYRYSQYLRGRPWDLTPPPTYLPTYLPTYIYMYLPTLLLAEHPPSSTN